MFGKVTVKEGKVKAFNDAINAVRVFIRLEEWPNAYKAIEEIKEKEKAAYNNLISEIHKEEKEVMVGKTSPKKLEVEKNKLLKTFNDRVAVLDKLKTEAEDKEAKFNKRMAADRFKVRFLKIKDEINILTKTGKNNHALNLLGVLLEENKNNNIIVNFYNKEKKKIFKYMEKERKKEDEKLKRDAKLEAMNLIGGDIEAEKMKEEALKENDPKKRSRKGIFYDFIKKLNFYRNVKEKMRKKKLIDEISILIEEDSKAKRDIASKKLENIHKGLIKELNYNKILGYDIFGKILGADKISGDTFGFVDSEKKYSFFLGDATGHGIRAGFIVTLLSRIFNKFVMTASLPKLAFEINNGLKQDLKNRSFITGIFFEINKSKIGTLNFVGMGHEPILIYRVKEHKIEKVIPGGLAAGIRIINDEADIKVKDINFEDGDILLTYSDGVIETKNVSGEIYGLKRLGDLMLKICTVEKDIQKIYDYIIKDLKLYKKGTNFADDTSILLLKRDEIKDVMKEDNQFITDLSIKEGLDKKQVKKLEGKTKDEIKVEIDKIKRDKELHSILKNLETLYYTGEILKLKQEAIRFIRLGYIDKKINYFLKKAIANETKYKIDQKNQKIASKYSVLSELYKKGDFNTVIKETEDIIGKDGAI